MTPATRELVAAVIESYQQLSPDQKAYIAGYMYGVLNRHKPPEDVMDLIEQTTTHVA